MQPPTTDRQSSSTAQRANLILSQLSERQTGRQTADRQTDRQIDRQIDGWKDQTTTTSKEGKGNGNGIGIGTVQVNAPFIGRRQE
jgi:hypothetical protein